MAHIHWQRRAAIAASMVFAMSACTSHPSRHDAVGPSSAAGNGSYPAAATGPLPANKAASLQAVLDQIVVDDSHLPSPETAPGVTAAVVSDRGVWTGAAGRDGRGTKLTPDAAMSIASITKTFVAAEVMHLVGTGKVALDAPMSTYVRHRLTANGATVRQELSMRGGLGDDSANPDAWERAVFAHPARHWTATETLGYYRSAPGRPGGESAYSNADFQLLGLLVEGVTHSSLAAAIRADLLGPAGVPRIVTQDAERPTPPLAAPRTTMALGPPDGFVPSRSIASAVAGAGSMAGDAVSVARWGYELYGSQVLSPALVARMITPEAQDTGKPGIPYTAYGLGTMLFSGAIGPDSLGHQGQAPGYNSLLIVVPERRESVAVLIPADDKDPYSVVRKLVTALGTP